MWLACICEIGFDPSFRSNWMVVSPLLLVLQIWNVKTAYRKSCSMILLAGLIRPLTCPLRSDGVTDTFNTPYLVYYWSKRFGKRRQLLGNHVPGFFLWLQL